MASNRKGMTLPQMLRDVLGEVAAEIRRLSEQRNQLQELALNGRIKSSRRNK